MNIGRIAVKGGTPREAIVRYARHRFGRERLRRRLLALPKWLLGLRNYERVRRCLLGEESGHELTHHS